MSFMRYFDIVSEINDIIAELPEEFKIVYTYGAWDILHPGHVKLLCRAKELGDFLIVGVVGDGPISKLKGPSRPLQTVDERLFTVSAFRPVDAALIQPEYDPSSILRKITRVDILTKGDDWEYIPGQETISDLGGKLIKLDYTKGVSSSSLISKMSKDNSEC